MSAIGSPHRRACAGRFCRDTPLQRISAAGGGPRRPALRHRCRHHWRRVPLPGSDVGADGRAAFGDCGGGAAGQRVLHAVCRIAGRLDGPQAADDPERVHVCAEHSGHCALAWLWAAVFRPAAAGHERRTDRRGGSAVSGRVPVGLESRQRARPSFSGC